MNKRDGTNVAGILNRYKTQRAAAFRVASSFPPSGESYLNLSPKKRMRRAGAMMARYASVKKGTKPGDSGSDWGVRITEDTDTPGLLLEARTAFMDGDWIRSSEVYVPPEIVVYARGAEEGTEDPFNVEFSLLGRIMLKHARGKSSTRIPLYMGESSKEIPIEDEEAGEVVRIIDAASISLIEGIVSRHRLLDLNTLEG